MLGPNFVNLVNLFYPVGNTPAVVLTQGLPNEESARILLLGCGDARNVLATAYYDNHHTLDITSCDIEPAIIGKVEPYHRTKRNS